MGLLIKKTMKKPVNQSTPLSLKTPDTGVRGAPRCLDKYILPDLTEKSRGFEVRCQRFSATDEEIKSFVCKQDMEE